jgi:hypothetical protein
MHPELLSFVKRWLPVLLVVLGLSVAFASTGCVASGRGTVRGGATIVYSEPPPPRVYYVAPRPGWIWVDGSWSWSGSRWVWVDGYWLRERPGYVYERGYWQRSGTRYVWVQPRWREHRGNVNVRSRPGRPNVRVNEHRR